jgi:transcriptional regulator of heat shock response
MSNLTQRNIDILKIIVEEFLETWEVLWSKLLLQKYDLWVSSATVRWDMAKLETLELIYQPYNSAWRLPTSKWLRAFINYLMKSSPPYFLKESNINIWEKKIEKLSDFVHKINFELANNTWEISFFIIPQKHIIWHSWIWNFLEKNHKRLWDGIFSIIKMLEDKFSFSKFIQNFPIVDGINIFIWEENILPYLKDYTIILKSVRIDWNIWYIWIIWSLKMNYSFNISAVRGII